MSDQTNTSFDLTKPTPPARPEPLPNPTVKDDTSTDDSTGFGFLCAVAGVILAACSPAIVIAVWQALL